jgi:hypothetical protein
MNNEISTSEQGPEITNCDNNNTPSKPLDKKLPSPSPNIGSSLPVKISTPPLEP